MSTPQLIWDLGTAYDLFISLVILQKPASFGLRGAWTAGVRARISPAEREIVDESMSMFGPPLAWIHSQPQPKNSITALWALDQTPPAERLALLSFHPTTPASMTDLFREVSARGSWDKKDLDAYRHFCECELDKKREDDKLERELASWWAKSAEFGERYLGALRSYHQAFFAEEEERIRPALENALARAQELAKELPLPDLLEKLSHGLRYDELPDVQQLVLVPSFWSTPFVFMDFHSEHNSGIWLFGARPADASLIPGEVVPDALLRALKALSDPTRLRILHALAREPHTPAQLARHLRLRAPTVTHHLKSLRAAGLVQMTVVGKQKEPQRYAVRSEAIASTCATMQSFLSGD